LGSGPGSARLSLAWRTAKAAGLAVAVLLLLTCLYIAAAFALVLFPANTGKAAPPSAVDAYVIAYGAHTDLVFPASTAAMDWTRYFPAADFEKIPATADYVAIGWGDREFYLNTPEWKDLTVPRAAGALFGMHGTLLHVTYLKKTDFLEYAHVLPLSAEQYALLAAYVLESAPHPNNRMVAVPGKRYTPQDAFFKANGAYNMFNTCNAWVGEGLLRAGVPVSRWTPFDALVVWHLQSATR
jgi:uncharacterized protein (TIGR02117 family)